MQQLFKSIYCIRHTSYQILEKYALQLLLKNNCIKHTSYQIFSKQKHAVQIAVKIISLAKSKNLQIVLLMKLQKVKSSSYFGLWDGGEETVVESEQDSVYIYYGYSHFISMRTTTIPYEN